MKQEQGTLVDQLKSKSAFKQFADMEVGSYDPTNPNACIEKELKKIDYKNLTGDNWQRLNALSDLLMGVGHHVPNGVGVGSSFEYAVFRAKPVFKDRYPGLPNTPRDLDGIEIVDENSLTGKTKITVRIAQDLNSQIQNGINPPAYGKYYLPIKQKMF